MRRNSWRRWGTQIDVATLPIVAGQQPVDIARRAMQAAKLQGYDVLMLDTAGRLHVDQALMDEMKAVADVAKPAEILLVVDSLTGQDAVNVAENFSTQVPLTGVVLTRMDGDARGGAALSMRAVTGKPIKFGGGPAKSSTRSKLSIRGASRAESWAWATSSAWSNAPPNRSSRKTPNAWRRALPRVSST